MTARTYEVYLIESEDYWYVGSTVIGVQKRWKQHVAGRGSARLLWEKLQELSPEAFSCSVIDRGHGNPVEAEQRWYEKLVEVESRLSLNGRSPIPAWTNYGRSPGFTHSDETRAKIGAGNRGKVISQEQREKLSIAGKGKHRGPFSDLHRERLSVAHKGKVPHNLGKPMAESQKEQLRQARLGLRASPEARQKMSTSQKVVVRPQYLCGECDMVTNAGCIGRHQKTTGHQGRTFHG